MRLYLLSVIVSFPNKSWIARFEYIFFLPSHEKVPSKSHGNNNLAPNRSCIPFNRCSEPLTGGGKPIGDNPLPFAPWQEAQIDKTFLGTTGSVIFVDDFLV